MKDDTISHRTVCFGEGIGLVLDAEHSQVLAACVLQRTLAIGSNADNSAFADREDLTIHLILAFTLQDNVQLLMSLVTAKTLP